VAAELWAAGCVRVKQLGIAASRSEAVTGNA